MTNTILIMNTPNSAALKTKKCQVQYWSLLNWRTFRLRCGCGAVPASLFLSLFRHICLYLRTLHIAWSLVRLTFSTVCSWNYSQTYTGFWRLKICKTSLSIILDKNLTFIVPWNAVCNAWVVFDVFTRCTYDISSTTELFFILSLLTCIFKKYSLLLRVNDVGYAMHRK